MLLVLFKTILLLVCLLTFMPIIYAENNLSPVEAIPLVMLGQNNLPEPLTIDNTRVNQELGSAPSSLRPEYPSQEYEYFKEEKRSVIYGQSGSRFKSEIEDDDQYKNDREILREKWRDFLGVDLFYLYFKAKDLETWVKDKFSVKLFNMKGRPQFNKRRILYVFKATF